MKIIIVDENDREIGSKSRDEISSNDFYRVSALWITNGKGDILLAQRSFKKKNNPGKWGPGVAGTIEIGETYDSNIYKEAEEELGIVGFELTKLHKVKNLESVDRKYFCQWYHLVIDKPIGFFKKQEEEVEDIKWFSQQDLVKEIESNPEKFLSSLEKYLGEFAHLK